MINSSCWFKTLFIPCYLLFLVAVDFVPHGLWIAYVSWKIMKKSSRPSENKPPLLRRKMEWFMC